MEFSRTSQHDSLKNISEFVKTFFKSCNDNTTSTPPQPNRWNWSPALVSCCPIAMILPCRKSYSPFCMLQKTIALTFCFHDLLDENAVNVKPTGLVANRSFFFPFGVGNRFCMIRVCSFLSFNSSSSICDAADMLSSTSSRCFSCSTNGN